MSTPESLKIVSVRDIEFFFAGMASGPAPDAFVKIAPAGPAVGRAVGADGSTVWYRTGEGRNYTITLSLLRTSAYNANLTAAHAAELVGLCTIVDGSTNDVFTGSAVIVQMAEVELTNSVKGQEWTFFAHGTLLAGGIP
jgi:hypothetical protein